MLDLCSICARLMPARVLFIAAGLLRESECLMC